MVVIMPVRVNPRPPDRYDVDEAPVKIGAMNLPGPSEAGAALHVCVTPETALRLDLALGNRPCAVILVRRGRKC
jgi:hypothetical protein